MWRHYCVREIRRLSDGDWVGVVIRHEDNFRMRLVLTITHSASHLYVGGSLIHTFQGRNSGDSDSWERIKALLKLQGILITESDLEELALTQEIEHE